jgi:hypothetical protein
MSKDGVKDRWDDLMQKLATERDELALKVHLGRKEAVAEWEKLEAKWHELRALKGPPLKEAARDTAKGLSSAADSAIEELRKGYERVRKLL